MVQEKRCSTATAYTERDTPMFTCLRQDLKVILERLSFKGAGASAALSPSVTEGGVAAARQDLGGAQP